MAVVINTYNRAASLRLTLEGLRHLDHPCFEVVVVNGPSVDDTAQVLEDYRGRIKVATCPERNLSMSRNIGIAVAAAPVVAFIDDDAYPDPGWLNRLVEAYADAEVGGAGGPVFDHTGAEFQTRYIISDRIGRSILTFGTNPSEWLNLPGAGSFVRLIGTNCSFRRDRLVEIGGFDEEFEYYLDETDVCVRLIDAGYVIRQLDGGFVYHKFLPSDIRSDNRVARDRFSVLKNTCYLALKHARAGWSFYELCAGLADFVRAERGNVVGNLEQGHLSPQDLAKFDADVPVAFDTAWQHFLAGPPRTRPASWFGRRQEPFLRFPTLRRADDKLHICLVSQDYPPRLRGGIGRATHVLATGLAALGHVVRVLTRGDGHNRVDFEDGVWVHRIVPVSRPAPPELAVPPYIWDHASAVATELHRIETLRHIDVVQAPNWDSEGLAVLVEGAFPCVVGLYTPMRTLQRFDQALARDPVAHQLAACERECYLRAAALVADSQAVIEEIESTYHVALPSERVEVCHLGLKDRAGAAAPVSAEAERGASGASPAGAVPAGADRRPGEVRIAFVGRLEKRKGIDTLLDCLPALLDQLPEVTVVLAGVDDIPSGDGATFRSAFETSPAGQRLGHRVRFLGAVNDVVLDRVYAGCDIVVAPSRFESFGLIALEAMMFSKPFVGCDVGGYAEVLGHSDTALLVPPGDSEALGAALADLCRSPERRRRLGQRGRALFEERFTDTVMVSRMSRIYERLAGRATTAGPNRLTPIGQRALS